MFRWLITNFFEKPCCKANDYERHKSKAKAEHKEIVAVVVLVKVVGRIGSGTATANYLDDDISDNAACQTYAKGH